MAIVETIQEGGWQEWQSYAQRWFYRGSPGCGFLFDCDKEGNIFEEKLTEISRENLRKCRAGEEDLVYDGIQTFYMRGKQSKIGRCSCGTEVELDGFTNSCEGCGQLYNWAGQELCDPSEWGSETGEHPADILRIR